MSNNLDQTAEAVRKPGREYAAPRLISYGSLADLTQGGSYIGNDGNTSCTGDANAGDPACATS
jgi:hypothetical protein